MSSTSSSNSFEDNISRVFNDPEPISFSLLMELDSFAETPVRFQRSFTLEPNTTPDETNMATLAGAMSEEALEVAEEECQSNIPEMPSEAPSETNIATLAGAMGEKALEAAEEECQPNIPEMPSETPNETNIATLTAAAGEEAVEVAAEEYQSIIPAMPSRVNTTPSPATAGSKRGRKKKTKEEREEFYSRRPDWLPEGWRMEVKVRKDGATSGIRDRYFYEPRTSHRFRSSKEVEKFIETGEVPRYKPKPKTGESNVVPTGFSFSRPPRRAKNFFSLSRERCFDSRFSLPLEILNYFMSYNSYAASMRRYSPPYYSPPRRGYGGRGRSPPRRGYGGRKGQNNGSLLVRNIPLDCRAEELRAPFERFGPVRDVYIPKDYYSGEPRGFAFVQFVDPYDASEAQHHMNRQLFCGREITVVVAAETRKRPEEMRSRARPSRGPSGYGGRRSSNYGKPAGAPALARYLGHALLITHQVLELDKGQDPTLLPQDGGVITLFPQLKGKPAARGPRGEILHKVAILTTLAEDHTLLVTVMQIGMMLAMAMNAAVDRLMENTNSSVIKLALSGECFQGYCRTELKRIMDGGDAFPLGRDAYADERNADWRSPGRASGSPPGSRSRSADLSPRRSR
ncbi:serine/arginine-rich SC35-like protein splicing factor SCL30 [Cinnamomum micranthum f. kanehirae]|uniref:Serine/arginine-rich SC35-like protein splicing factor SCL30 n=1 Tax=Cinnamomum micranthum f. kanehirae TaxID=337451 RepID=A0A3S4NG07_9MAGN|nr:serine/arginine-rich SC35-like protein splicing factor SCL30 [Cinnamomum micranthum f. kanehirae]